MRKRVIKVSSIFYNGLKGRYMPYIKLGGKWLKDIGFNISDEVEITINNDNEITIKKLTI